MERTKGYKQILEFKDEVVFKLLVQKKELETKIRDDMDKAANDEINEWARFVVNKIIILLFKINN